MSQVTEFTRREPADAAVYRSESRSYGRDGFRIVPMVVCDECGKAIEYSAGGLGPLAQSHQCGPVGTAWGCGI